MTTGPSDCSSAYLPPRRGEPALHEDRPLGDVDIKEVDLPVRRHDLARSVHDDVAVAQVPGIGPGLLEAAQGEPEAERPRQLSVTGHHRAAQRLRHRQRRSG